MPFLSQVDLGQYLNQVQQNPAFTQAGQNPAAAQPKTAQPAPKGKKRYVKKPKARMV